MFLINFFYLHTVINFLNNLAVQGPKAVSKKIRAYCTKSGLQRNKRLSVVKIFFLYIYSCNYFSV